MKPNASAYERQEADYADASAAAAAEQAAEMASAGASADLPNGDLPAGELALKAQIAKLSEMLAEQKDAHMRAAAEFENIKKRIERQHASDLEYANAKLIKDLLPLLDALDQAGNFEADDEFSAGLKEGVINIIRLFAKTLEAYGVSKIEPNLGDVIDPEQHEVLMNQPSKEVEPGTISMVMQCGYILKDRVIRAAKVAANN